VNIEAAVQLAHALEDVLEAARAGAVRLGAGDVDVLLEGADLLAGRAEGRGAAAAGGGGGARGGGGGGGGGVARGAAGGVAGRAAHRGEVERLAGRYQAMAGGEVRAGSASDRSGKDKPSPPLEAPPPATSRTVVIPEAPILPGDEAPLFDLFREEARSQALAL